MASAVEVADVRRAYFTPWTMTCPIVSSDRKVDCIWGYAFGRNSYADAELGKLLADMLDDVHGDQDDLFTLLRVKGFEPGQPNLALAIAITEYVEALYWRIGIPTLINQWEINYCIWRYCAPFFKKYKNFIHSLWAPSAKAYYNSIDVTHDAIALTAGMNLKQPALFAHDAHRVRPLTICWKQGWSPVVPAQSITGFDPKSVQSGPSSKAKWLQREILARTHHLVTGAVSLTPPSLA